MAELEELGYLDKPHTSAGRIPSELGYRFYVDTLVSQYDSKTKEAGELKKMLSVKMSEIDKILDKVKKSGYTALTTEEKQRLFDAKKN
jgi:heat-inducible transcriptional repressor